MSNLKEALEEIAAKLRKDAEVVESDAHDGETWENYEMGFIYRDIADRIEAAIADDETAAAIHNGACERQAIGNVAALRKALERISKQEELFHRHMNNDEYARSGDAIEFLYEASEAAKAALAAKPRNCDRFATHDECWDAFLRERPRECHADEFFIDWLFDTAEGADHA